jgi:large subunit ribosomal protein L4
MVTKTKSTSKALLATALAHDGSVSEVKLDAAIFGNEVNKSVLAQYVRVLLANMRQGTASTKDRSQIIGTTKKVYKQKGTGNARHGSMKAPIYVGGGIVGGPKPRDYSLAMSKKQRVVAMKSALAQVAEDKKVVMLDAKFSTTIKRTAEFTGCLKTSKISSRSFLIVVDQAVDAELMRATRNVEGVTLVGYDAVNAYEIAKSHKVAFTKDGYTQFVTRFSV